MKKRKNNKGFSLVELVVVIAIMGILVGLTGYGVSLISTKAADECAQRLQIMLERSRTTVMGKSDAYLELYTSGDKIVVKETIINGDGTISEPKVVEIGGSGVTLEYYLTENPSATDPVLTGPISLGTTPLKIAFSRDSGSLRPSTGSVADGNARYCVKFEITKGSKTREVTIVQLTGKVTSR